MKELTPEQLQDNWNKLIQLIKDTFPEDYPDDRRGKLLKMYHHFEERMMFAPASGKEHFHNCYAGGYVEHVIHVTTSALQIKELWEKNGANIDFTDEELVFAALHHDLGKVGDLAENYYTPNDSDWHRKNQGLVYKHNGNLQYMSVTDRALFLLQHFGVSMTEKEYIGLMLTDGLYEEANKSYYIGYSPDRALKTNIAYILHQADMMATHIEFDQWKRGDHLKKVVKQEEVKVKTEQSTAANQAFKELFGE
tara:strand:- start:648 stop:1400 length:753 start_codon:yes stop_codon:yes gene_type:complete